MATRRPKRAACTSTAQRTHKLAVKIVLAALGCAHLTASGLAQQQAAGDHSVQLASNESQASGGELTRLAAGYATDDDELARTLDRTNDDEFSVNLASASLLAPSRPQDDSVWVPLGNHARRSDETKQSSSDVEQRQYLNVMTNNQTGILMGGPISQNNSSGPDIEQMSATYLLINRAQTNVQPDENQIVLDSTNSQIGAKSEPIADSTMKTSDQVGASQLIAPNSTIDRTPLVERPSALPSERFEISHLPTKSQLADLVDLERPLNSQADSQAELKSRDRRKRKRKKKKKRINELPGGFGKKLTTEIHMQQPEVKMISYSAVGAKKKDSSGADLNSSKPSSSWSGESQLVWSSLGPPTGAREAALRITSAPSYLGSQQVSLLGALTGSESQAMPLLSSLHDLKLRAQQVRKRQREHLLSAHLNSPAPAKESFMFDASSLPARIAHLFPSVLEDHSGSQLPLTTGKTTLSNGIVDTHIELNRQNDILDKQSTNSSPGAALRQPETQVATYEESQTRPYESLLSLADQHRPVHDESMATSSSQPNNEFETTLKHQQRVPIVNGADVSNPDSSSSSETSTLSSSSSSPNSIEGVDTNESNEPGSAPGYVADDQDSSSSPTSREPNELGNAVESAERHHESRQENKSRSPEVGGERELLVGPFKSESEAPNTITLSGVVYQKSGASSPFVRGTLSKNEQESTTGQRTSEEKLTKASKQMSVTDKQQSHLNSLDKRPPSAASQSHQIHQLPAGLAQLLVNLKGSSNGQLDLQLADSSKEYPRLVGATSAAPELFQPGSLKLSASASSPLSSMLLLSSLMNSGVQLDEEMLSLLEPPKSLLAPPNAPLHSSALLSPGGLSKGSKGALLAAAQEQAPIWASKKGEQYYLGAHLSASDSNPTTVASTSPVAAASGKHKEKSGPIVIVQKDVKPVKYHLLKAYLKLRRLLRPSEATYVFPNTDPNGIMRRRNHPHHPPAPKATGWPPLAAQVQSTPTLLGATRAPRPAVQAPPQAQ